MVCTVGAARRFGGKKAVARSSASFAIGLLAGSMLVFGSLGVVATLLHPGRAWILAAAAVAAAAALSDAAGLRVRPQIPLQVPEHWRRTMPLPSALFMYGLLIGTGLTTYVPAAAAWALMVLSLALGKLVPALAVGVLLAAGRALPVLALIFRSNSETEPGRSERWVSGRGYCASSACSAPSRSRPGLQLRLPGPLAHASSCPRPKTRASPPPISRGSSQGWAAFSAAPAPPRYGSPATTPRLAARSSPGTSPAWSPSPTAPRSCRSSRKRPPGSRSSPSPSTWLAYRRGLADGGTRLVVQSLPDLGAGQTVASARWPSTLGRPYLSGNTVVFHVATRRGNWISAVDLATGKHRRLRGGSHVQLLNPSLLGSRLLYVRVSRCAQQLRLGGVRAGTDRVLFSLPPLAGQDRGHERGHTSQGGRVPCPGRPRPTMTILWTTALTSRFAYVTTLHPTPSGVTTPTLLQIAHK